MIATPIGHLGDLTLRALWALSQADAVFCEDTRVTGGLLHRLGIKKPLISCHDHNEEFRITDILRRLMAGERIALVSDAGTPLISDPGFRLVRACRENGFDVIALPGASAVLTALTCSGLPADHFMFVGFLPTKTAAQKTALKEVAGIDATLVFYESARRLSTTLGVMKTVFASNRRVVVARELTKLYEEIKAGTLGELADYYAERDAPKGEIVILVEAGESLSETPVLDLDDELRLALETMSVKDAAVTVAAKLGLKKKEVYARSLALTE